MAVFVIAVTTVVMLQAPPPPYSMFQDLDFGSVWTQAKLRDVVFAFGSLERVE